MIVNAVKLELDRAAYLVCCVHGGAARMWGGRHAPCLVGFNRVRMFLPEEEVAVLVDGLRSSGNPEAVTVAKRIEEAGPPWQVDVGRVVEREGRFVAEAGSWWGGQRGRPDTERREAREVRRMTKRESMTEWAEAAKRYAEQCAERGDWLGAARYAGEAVDLELLAEVLDTEEQAESWV